MRKPDRSRWAKRSVVSLVAVCSILLLGAGTYALASGSAASRASAATTPSQRRAAAALTAPATTTVFTLADGEQFGVIEIAGQQCLIGRKDGNVVSATCADAAGIAEGNGITVNDECGSSGRNAMTVSGLAPEGATAVRLDMSDGTFRTAPAVHGGFAFEGTNPGPGERYPIGVEWVTQGARLPVAGWPVAGDQFCVPAE